MRMSPDRIGNVLKDDLQLHYKRFLAHNPYRPEKDEAFGERRAWVVRLMTQLM